MNLFKQTVIGAAVTAIAVAGPVIAIDYGGVLHWTQYIAALGVFVLGLIAILLAATRNHLIGLSQLTPLLPILLWAGFSWFQCVPLSPQTIQTLSPGSFSAYVDWLGPLLPEQLLSDKFPISIAPDQSQHAASVLVLVPAFLCSVLVIVRDRGHLIWALILLSLGIGLHAAYGIAASLVPAISIHDGAVHKVGFGTFINNNNLAFLLNTGIACGLGLLVSRWFAASTTVGLRDETLGRRVVAFLTSDPVAWVGLGTLLACFAGLLTCGSRSGLTAVLIGGMATYLWLRRGAGWLTLPAAAAVVCLVVLVFATIVTPLANGLESIEQLRQMDLHRQSDVQQNVRFQHWPDAFRAALHYLPAGSGISTYSHAYLPYQQAPLREWFHHADNLWLELLVEQGIVGVTLMLATAAIAFRALLRLSHSNDPIDVGLQVAGAYALGCVAWSQMFDFGFIIPGNLFAFITFWGLVLSRTQMNARADTDRPHASQAESAVRFVGGRVRVTSAVFCAAVLAPVLLVLPTLRQDAEQEHIVQAIQVELANGRGDESSRRRQLNRIDQALTERPTSRMYDLAALLNRRLGRVALVASMNPANAAELSRALDATEAVSLSATWHRDPAELPALPPPYFHSVEAAQRSLVRLPLGIMSRVHLLALQFAHENRKQAAHSLQQLAALQKGFAERLVRTAAFASAMGNEPTAARLFQQATAANPRKSRDALLHAQADPRRNIADYIADRTVCQRLVSSYLLENPAQTSIAREQANAFLKHSVPLLHCEQCERNAERSNCEEIAGSSLLSIGETTRALERYREAIRRTPGQISLRRKIIQRLIDAGRNEEAIDLATQSYAVLPKHFPFKVIADRLKSADQSGQENTP